MKSYFRFLWKNRLYTVIELAGLSVSIGFVILLLCYTIQQYSITREFEDRERIYVMGLSNFTSIPYGIADGIRGKIPEVEQVARYLNMSETTVKSGDAEYNATTAYVDPEIFDLLGKGLKEGNIPDLEDWANVFVSESFANRIGSDGKGVLGRRISINDQQFTVAGIYNDIGKSVFYRSDILLNIRHPELMKGSIDNPLFMIIGVATLVKAREGTSPAELSEKINSVYSSLYGNTEGAFLENKSLTRIDELYFADISSQFTQGDKKLVNNLLTVGLVLLLCAVFNYINLNTALTGKRAREMATRRLLGTSRGGIVIKYIKESFLFTALCFAIGVAIALTFAPVMNNLLAGDDGSYWKEIDMGEIVRPGYMLFFLGIYVIVSLVSGVIPAVLASKFTPMDIIRGTFRLQSRLVFSKVFIVLQNMAAIVLIALSITMEAQMKHMLARPVGCNTDDLFYLSSPFYDGNTTVLMERLQELPCVEMAGYTYDIPGKISLRVTSPKDEITGRYYQCYILRCDSVAFNMFGFNVVRKFSDPVPGSLWISEKAMKDSGSTPPYDDVSSTSRLSIYKDIGGVLSDFIVNNVTMVKENDYGAVEIIGQEDISSSSLLLKTRGDHKEAEKAITETASRLYSEIVGGEMGMSRSGYIDDIMKEDLNDVRNSVRIIELFMILAVVISAMGLTAMSIYHASENSKSIALHKIYGGTVGSETGRNIRVYMLMTAIADLLAVPVAVILCQRYLQGFPYRMDLPVWIFVVTVAVSLAITAVSVLWQVNSAARANPVDALKSE